MKKKTGSKLFGGERHLVNIKASHYLKIKIVIVVVVFLLMSLSYVMPLVYNTTL